MWTGILSFLPPRHGNIVFYNIVTPDAGVAAPYDEVVHSYSEFPIQYLVLKYETY